MIPLHFMPTRAASACWWPNAACPASHPAAGQTELKAGLHDSAEVFFDDVRVPAANPPGREGGGFAHLVVRLPPERLSIAMMALAPVRAALDWTVDYLTQRTAFGRPLAAFQNTRFELAASVTEVHVLEACLDKAVLALTAGTLTAAGAARARLWATEVSTASWTGACSCPAVTAT